MRTTSNMNDDERKETWATLIDPRESLEEMLAHSEFIGSDPYYRDLNDALWAMAARALQATMPTESAGS